MSKDYKDEISEVGAPGSAPETCLKPVEEFSVSCNFLDGPFFGFQQRRNRLLRRPKRNGAVSIEGQIMECLFFLYSTHASLQSKVKKNTTEKTNTEFRLHKGYVKFSVDNFEIQVEEIQSGGGRDITAPFSCRTTLNLLT